MSRLLGVLQTRSYFCACVPAIKKADSALCQLSDELLLAIFSNLLEQDLCRVSRVCKRFHSVANDKKLWKPLYKDVFEYDLVLLNKEKNQFDFHSPDDLTCANPWKMSMSRMYHGLHVRPRYHYGTIAGRSVKYFSTVREALDHPDATLVFLHAGTHRIRRFRKGAQMALIGAAPGTVAESVVLLCRNNFPDGPFARKPKDVYLGHITLLMKFHLVIDVSGTCIFDHCLLDDMDKGSTCLSFVTQEGVKVFQMKHCVVVRDSPDWHRHIAIYSKKPVLRVRTKFDAQQPLPASCPWVRQGLDVTKHGRCKCIDVCGSPGVTGEH